MLLGGRETNNKYIVPWANRWTDLQHLLINTVELRVVYFKYPVRTKILSQLILIEKSVMKRLFYTEASNYTPNKNFCPERCFQWFNQVGLKYCDQKEAQSGFK